MAGVQIVFLGTGDAFAAGGRFLSSCLVRSDGFTLLLDCGPTVLTALKRLEIGAGILDAVFFSHLHGDHIAGAPFLLMEYIYCDRRRRPLTLIGPPGSRDRIMTLFGSMYPETAQKPLPFDLKFLEIRPPAAADLGGMVLHLFPVPHQETAISLGCKIETGGRRILYSGDTGWTEDLVNQAEETDLFICECSFFQTRLPCHLDYRRLLENRERFKTGRLILTHLGQEVLSRSDEVEDEMAHDGLTIDM
jgi:ribonuclease BN (tRNA processing enzyme)